MAIADAFQKYLDAYNEKALKEKDPLYSHSDEIVNYENDKLVGDVKIADIRVFDQTVQKVTTQLPAEIDALQNIMDLNSQAIFDFFNEKRGERDSVIMDSGQRILLDKTGENIVVQENAT